MKKFILLSFGLLTVLSCKKEAETVHEHEVVAPTIETPDASETSTVTLPADGIVRLEITGDDQMKFDKKELKVPAGAKVELTLKHSGKMSVEAMGHDWVLLKPGTDIVKFATDALSQKDNGYIPANSTDVIAHTKMIGAGESTTITFDAPEKGTYDFVCTFPGHYGSMQGKFIVE